MPVIFINNHEYSCINMFKLKQFAFSLEHKDIDFCCRTDFKCGVCLFCKCDLIDTKFHLSKLTKFYEFICHKFGGGYVSGKKYGEFFNKNNMFIWGDLDKLKIEAKEINRHKMDMTKELVSIWSKLYQDILSAKEVLEITYKL